MKRGLIVFSLLLPSLIFLSACTNKDPASQSGDSTAPSEREIEINFEDDVTEKDLITSRLEHGTDGKNNYIVAEHPRNIEAKVSVDRKDFSEENLNITSGIMTFDIASSILTVQYHYPSGSFGAYSPIYGKSYSEFLNNQEQRIIRLLDVNQGQGHYAYVAIADLTPQECCDNQGHQPQDISECEDLTQFSQGCYYDDLIFTPLSPGMIVVSLELKDNISDLELKTTLQQADEIVKTLRFV